MRARALGSSVWRASNRRLPSVSAHNGKQHLEQANGFDNTDLGSREAAARDATRNSCKRGDSSNPVAVALRMVDDDGDVIPDASKGGVVCTEGEPSHVKFTARYDVTHCQGSVAPSNSSNGDVAVTATSSGSSLDVTRRVHCKR